MEKKKYVKPQVDVIELEAREDIAEDNVDVGGGLSGSEIQEGDEDW